MNQRDFYSSPMRLANYCGPFALHYVSNLSREAAALAICEISGADPGRTASVKASHLDSALHRHCEVIAHLDTPGLSLARWAAIRAHHGDTNPWVVWISKHYVVYHNGVIHQGGVKNHENMCNSMPVAEFNRRTARIKRAWCIKTVNSDTLVSSV